MLKEDYFRILAILKDNEAITFKSNVVKMVEAILYYNDNQKMTVNEIIKKIDEKFSLLFTAHEVIVAIKDKGTGIIKEKAYEDPTHNIYYLTPSCYEKVKIATNRLSESDIFTEFIQSHEGINISINECSNIIMKYLYYAFCKDVNTLKKLLNQSDESAGVLTSEFTDDEKIIINKFLNWENRKKNEFVYNAITCGFDYCMLSMKKDNRILKGVFSGKKFYFDANIIFRLIGLNNIERKNSMKAFLKKCKEAEVTVKYTNFTLGELYNVIDYRVGQLKKLFSNNCPISTEAVRALNPRYANLDFLDEYVKWTKQSSNRVGHYEEFIKELRLRVNRVLNDFEIESSSSFNANKTKDEFLILKKDLLNYKKKKYKDTYESTVEVDIENYMLVSKKYKKSQRVNVIDTNFYIITADHLFVDWAYEQIPNIVPIVMLPSVWYSILLKFHGRTDDDYKAFSSFLNFRFSIHEAEQYKTDEILQLVANLSESTQIKDEIIYEISNDIQNYKQEDISAEDIVEKATESILQKHVKNEVDQNNKKWKERYEFDINELAEENKELQTKHLKILEQIKMEAYDAIRFTYYWHKVVVYVIYSIPIIFSIIILCIILNVTDNRIIQAITFLFPNAIYIWNNDFKWLDDLKRWGTKEYLEEKYIKKKCSNYNLINR